MLETSGLIHDFSCQLVLASLPALGGNGISRARTKLPAAFPWLKGLPLPTPQETGAGAQSPKQDQQATGMGLSLLHR